MYPLGNMTWKFDNFHRGADLARAVSEDFLHLVARNRFPVPILAVSRQAKLYLSAFYMDP